MKLTRSVSYAVGILLQIHGDKVRGPMTASRIAKDCTFPPRFLYRVLRRLVDAKLLAGTSGPGGGYVLAKPAGSVTLLDIVSAVDSPPEPSVLKPVRTKYRQPIDAINRLCADSAATFRAELAKTTLAGLLDRPKKRPGFAKKRLKPGSGKKAKSKKQAK